MVHIKLNPYFLFFTLLIHVNVNGADNEQDPMPNALLRFAVHNNIDTVPPADTLLPNMGADTSLQFRVGFTSLFSVHQADLKKGPLQYAFNEKAVSYIQTYMDKQGAGLRLMKTWAKPYFNLYDMILESKGIPTQLKYLSVIESHLSSMVTSSAGAVGPWQLMPAEATRLGLKLTPNDERTDYEKSTQAAAGILKELFDEFGDWLLVVAAYNGGAGRMRQTIKKMKTNDFWELQYALPLETRDHVKKFIATIYVFESDETNRVQFLKKPILLNKKEAVVDELVKVVIKGRYRAKMIAQYLAISLEQLVQLNPQMEKVLASGKSFELILPKGMLALFETHKNEILQASVQSLYKMVE